MDLCEMRRQKHTFSKEWPPGCDPPMVAFDYFNKRFNGVDGYNWWLLPCVSENGDPKHWGTLRDSIITMKFFYVGNYIATTRSDSWKRVGVLVKKDPVVYELYVDEDGYLFGSMTSEISVGHLHQVHRMWDGTADLDLNTLQEYPLAIVSEWS